MISAAPVWYSVHVKCVFIRTGAIAAHILGGASYGREGVASAEVIGVAGVERKFDEYLRDPANEGAPLELSIDLTIQAAAEEGAGRRYVDHERQRCGIGLDGCPYGRDYFDGVIARL